MGDGGWSGDYGDTAAGTVSGFVTVAGFSRRGGKGGDVVDDSDSRVSGRTGTSSMKMSVLVSPAVPFVPRRYILHEVM